MRVLSVCFWLIQPARGGGGGGVAVHFRLIQPAGWGVLSVCFWLIQPAKGGGGGGVLLSASADSTSGVGGAVCLLLAFG